MRMMKTSLMVAVIMLTGVSAGGADNKPAAPVTWATTMPSIELSNQPLEKVLNELKAKLPGFNFSISRENVPHDYPVLPTITLENVSLGQFVTIVQQQIPGVQIQSNDGAGNSIFNGQVGNSPFCAIYVKPNSSSEEASVHVFGLAEIIAYRASLIPGEGDHTRQASDDVLSLIQASLDEQNILPKAEMKLHPSTQVLICHVTTAQEELVKQVLDSLKPRESDQIVKLRGELTDLQERYKIKVNNSDAFEIRARTLQARESDLGVQIDKLTKELDDATTQLDAAKHAAIPQK